MEENTRQKLISLLEQNLRKERCQEDEIVALKMQCTEYDAKYVLYFMLSINDLISFTWISNGTFTYRLKDVTMELTNVKMQ